MTTPCSEKPPRRLAVALAQFDAGDYFSCHETLEELWLAERRPVRDFYKGLLMIAVALHHDARGKRKGPLRTMNRALELLSPFVPRCMGLDVESVLTACAAMLAHLQTAREGETLPAWLTPRLGPLLAL